MRSHAKASSAGSSMRRGSSLGLIFRGALATFATLAAFAGIGASAALAQSAPTVTVTGSSQVGVTSAKLEGEVNPEGEAGSPSTFFHFEVSADNGSGEPDGNWIFVNGNPDGEISGSEAEAASPVAVEGIAEGLAPATTYFIRLAADNAEFANHAETGAPFESFTTAAATAPVLATEASEAIGYTIATLKGSVDPEGGNVNPIGGPLAINWQLEYREAGVFGPGEGWNFAGNGEISGAEAEGSTPVTVKATLPPGALQPAKSYEVHLFVNYLGFTRTAESPEAELPEDEFETEAAAKPQVSTPLVTAVTDSSAHFAAEVNPNAPKAASELEGESAEELDIKAAFHTNWSFQCEPGCPGPGGELGADDSFSDVPPIAEEGIVKGLKPNQPYEVTLHATNAGGEALSAVETFKTDPLPPSVALGTNTPIGDEEVELRGYVNPFNSPATDCHFEYGPTASYGSSAPCEGDPNGPGSGFNGAPPPALVTARLGELTPGASYHFRLVVQTEDGGAAVGSEDGIFQLQSPFAEPGCSNEARRSEQHAAFLTDCRAFEQVSPPDKNGGDVTADSGRTRVASDGSAATFGSLAAFADPLSAPVATDYESVRGPGGWATHAITPLQPPTTLKAISKGLSPHYADDFSADLSKGVFLALSPLTDDPNVAKVANLYLRDDLRSPGTGSYQLLTPCPLCEGPGGEALPALLGNISGAAQPRPVGASADYGHVAFESQQPLLEGFEEEDCSNLEALSKCPGKLYESDHGTLRLVGLVPRSGRTQCTTTCEPSKLGSLAGQDTSAFQGTIALTPHVVSSDGSRIFFTVPSSLKSPSGALYMREDATKTVQLNVSECCGEEGKPSSAPAKYWGASDDGSRVFFISGATLTADAPHGGLYMYDVDASAGHHLTLISADNEPADGADVVNVQGMSSNGHYVYFAAAGQLVAGQPAVNRALYVWHDGTVRFIADMRAYPDRFEDTNTVSWSFFRPTARVTPDGLHMIFSSTEPGPGPTGYDQGHCDDNAQVGTGCRMLYLYSYPTQRLSCATCGPSGEPAEASALVAVRVDTAASPPTPYQNHPLADDGSKVFFTMGGSVDGLVQRDTNGVKDAYVYDTRSGTVHLLSSGTDKADSYFMNATPDGTGAFIRTREKLTGTDVDLGYDIYDARTGGGFVEPLPPPICVGDSCQGAAAPQPDNQTPGSASASGPVNPSTLRCRKGKVKRRGRCVARKSRKSKNPKSHKRAANQSRRTSR